MKEEARYLAVALIAASFVASPQVDAQGTSGDQAGNQLSGYGEGELFPPAAQPGECYARVFVPPTYRTVTEDMLKKEESYRLEIAPAKYEWGTQVVTVREASTKIEVIPARYDWVQEQVLVKEASSRMVEVPATYVTETEQILEQPAHLIWKRGNGPIEKLDNMTGEIMCLVEVPAKYKTVTRRVLSTPATTKEITIPAEYSTVKKRVLVEKATTRTIAIPAQYDTIRVRKMVSPPEERKVVIPAEYQRVTKRQKVTDGHMAWRQLLCETNMNATIAFDIQRALKKAGYNPGPIDGVIGHETMAAVNKFQRAKSLPEGGLTFETLAALGVKSK